jgi:Glycine zipper
MKKVLLSVGCASLIFVACNTRPDGNTQNPSSINTSASTLDTAGLAQFGAWKVEQELAASNSQQLPANTIVYEHPEQTSGRAVGHKSVLQERSYSATAPGSTSHAPRNSEPVSMTSTSSNTAQAPAKAGWNKAKKGAVIGAGSGAILGAVLDKGNRAVGGVIGGVLGAAVGYGIGHHMDQKGGW